MKFVFTVQGLLTYTTVYYCSGADAGNSLKEGGIFWSLLMIVSFLLQAADTVLKVIIVFQSSLHFLSFQTISLWLHWHFSYLAGANLFGCIPKTEGLLKWLPNCFNSYISTNYGFQKYGIGLTSSATLTSTFASNFGDTWWTHFNNQPKQYILFIVRDSKAPKPQLDAWC